MAYNKVMDKLGNVLIDLSGDTVTPEDVVVGKAFHDKSGNLRVGTRPVNIGDSKEPSEYTVNFWDYDGTLVACYTLEEARNLAALPPLPDHTDDNLDEGCWTETLEFVKNLESGWNIGRNCITLDGYTHLTLNLTDTLEVWFAMVGDNTGTLTVDWGDGNVTEHTLTNSTSKVTHTYAESGMYDVKMIHSGSYYYFTHSSYTNSNVAAQVIKLQLSSQFTDFTPYGFRNFNIRYFNTPYTLQSWSLSSSGYLPDPLIIFTGTISDFGAGGSRLFPERHNAVCPDIVIMPYVNDNFTKANLNLSSYNTIKHFNFFKNVTYVYSLSKLARREFIFGENLISINGELFNGSKYAEKLVIAASSIKTYAFSQSPIRHVEFLPASTFKTLSGQVFWNAYDLKYLKYPNSLITDSSDLGPNTTKTLEVLDLTALDHVINTSTLRFNPWTEVWVTSAVYDAYKAHSIWSQANLVIKDD